MLRLVDRLQRFFASWRFPALVLAVLTAYAALTLVVLLVPAPPALAAFADEFRMWCFGWDPAKKTMERVYVFQAFAEPIGLSFVVAFLWREQLARIWRARKVALVPYAVGGVAVVAAAGAVLVSSRTTQVPLVFPARSLRVTHDAPILDLVDQRGTPTNIAAFHGKVVMLTGVYTSCGLTCPRLLAGSRKAILALSNEDRADVVVLAITLDPEHDSPKELARLAHAQKVDGDAYHFLTGPPADVNRALDSLEIARTRDPKTGVIDHASVFVLVDRRGHIAYRIALGTDLEDTWLVDALKILLREPA